MISIRAMTAADIDFGMRLKSQAGWNQVVADWQRFLSLQPDGCWVAEWNGQPAGTVVVCGFGDVAWIAMMLVEESLRKRGFGRALMEHALACAERLGATSIRLDATPLGQPLYERLGFRGDFALTRYIGAASPVAPKSQTLSPVDLDAARRLDGEASGADRRKLMAALLSTQPTWVVAHGDTLAGFCVARDGSQAVQIGPCIARGDAGGELLQAALAAYAGRRVLVDVPDQQTVACEIVQSAGLTPQRPLLRMTRGLPVQDRPELIWASSGGEKG